MDYLVIDCETSGLDWKRDKLHGLAVCFNGHAEYYAANDFPIALLGALSDSSIPKVGHNLRFDLKFLRAAGIEVAGEYHDTRVMAHLLDEDGSTGLKDLTARYLGEGRLGNKAALDSACGKAGARNIAELCDKDIALNYGPYFQVIALYACEDVKNTESLFELFSSTIAKDEDLARYYQQEAQPFERVLLDLELNGIGVDVSVLDAYGVELRSNIAALEADMSRLAAAHINDIEENLYETARAKRKSTKGKDAVLRRSDKHNTRFLFSSGTHIGRLVYEKFGAPVRRTAKGNFDTAELTLDAIRQEATPPLKDFLEQFFTWRSLNKVLGTYVNGLKERLYDNRIYASYGQYTVTGRTHSSDPNMQNLPRGSIVKRAFVPASGNVFVYFDYSQIELRIAAHLSQDNTMLSWFQRNIDPHQDLANRVGIDRQTAKAMNFLTIYDGKYKRLHESLLSAGVTTYDEDGCKQLLSAYWENVPGYRTYLDDQLALVRSERCLRSSTGRIRRLPDIAYGDHLDWRTRSFRGPGWLVEGLRAYTGEYLSPEGLFERASIRYSHAKKQAFNFPVQHLGAHIMKRALLALREAGFVVVTSVHDSAVVELPIDQIARVSEITRIAESAMQISVPLKVDVKILNSLDEKDLFSLSENLRLA